MASGETYQNICLSVTGKPWSVISPDASGIVARENMQYMLYNFFNKSEVYFLNMLIFYKSKENVLKKMDRCLLVSIN